MIFRAFLNSKNVLKIAGARELVDAHSPVTWAPQNALPRLGLGVV